MERGLKEWIAMWASLIVANSYAMNHDHPDHKIGSIVWLLVAAVWYFTHLVKVRK